MTYETLLFDDRRDGIGIVTLNRPERANAMNRAMLRELDDLCCKLANDPALRCVIVTGAGSSFCSGFDLRDQAEATPQGMAEWTDVLEADFKAIMSFWNLRVPTIAAVNGPALAGGFELMLACDLAVAVESALFGEPEMRFGAGIVAMVLPWFVGPKVAKSMIYTGEDSMGAAEALRLGLVNRVVPAGELMSAATELGDKLARMDPMVLQRTKKAINGAYELMGMAEALRAALDIDILIEGEGSPLKREFLGIVRDRGLRQALAWRDARARSSSP